MATLGAILTNAQVSLTADVTGTLPAANGGTGVPGIAHTLIATIPASNGPESLFRNEHPVLAFDDTTAESLLIHRFVSPLYVGGDITLLIDWVAETATTGDVVWGGEFERITPGGQDIDSDGFAAQRTTTSTTNGTSGIVTRTTIVFTQAQADAVAANDLYRLRIQRVAADGGDTMTGDAQLLRVIITGS